MYSQFNTTTADSSPSTYCSKMNKKWCFSLVPAILATFAFMTSFLFSFWCQSVAFVPDAGADSTTDNNLQTIRVGPWNALITTNTTIPAGGGNHYFVQDNSCAAFPRGSLEVDAKLRAVRAFGILGLIIGGVLLWFLYLAPCLYFVNENTWRSVAIIYSVFLTLFQGLTFLIFESSFCTDNSILASYGLTDSYSAECVWDQGSTANVIATLLWFLTGVAMLYNGAPKRPARPPAETQTVTYQRTELPEGGSTIAEVGVVKGTHAPQSSSSPTEHSMEMDEKA